MLKFWIELFDKKSKSEAADRCQSKFKLSLLMRKKHQKKKKKSGDQGIILASQKYHKAVLTLDWLLRNFRRTQIFPSSVTDGQIVNSEDAYRYLLHDRA